MGPRTPQGTPSLLRIMMSISFTAMIPPLPHHAHLDRKTIPMTSLVDHQDSHSTSRHRRQRRAAPPPSAPLTQLLAHHQEHRREAMNAPSNVQRSLMPSPQKATSVVLALPVGSPTGNASLATSQEPSPAPISTSSSPTIGTSQQRVTSQPPKAATAAVNSGYSLTRKSSIQIMSQLY
jgi:hypothetical protein